ncbi:MAG: DUF445 family protein, partial [Staphylococcus sp.]|nr:DUF445 family protein [Staphylococcus sp.]
VILQKLNEPNTREAINDLVIKQLSKLKSDDATIRKFANQFEFDLDDLINNKLDKTIINKLNNYYYDKQATSINEILPADVITMVDEKLDQAGDLIRERARNYLSSDKGARDIYDMLDTFFAEKGKIVGLLQMFMTKESIAERVQHELIRLTRHPKAKVIIDKVIRDEYETLKSQPLSHVVKEEQFTNISESLVHLVITNIQLNEKMDTPISKLTPKLVDQIQVGVANTITDLIIKQASNHLSTIMTKINLRQMVENQINTFDLDYIERLIIEIANKELKLIMSLGFILGGIIGFFQGIVAIFV